VDERAYRRKMPVYLNGRDEAAGRNQDLEMAAKPENQGTAGIIVSHARPILQRPVEGVTDFQHRVVFVAPIHDAAGDAQVAVGGHIIRAANPFDSPRTAAQFAAKVKRLRCVQAVLDFGSWKYQFEDDVVDGSPDDARDRQQADVISVKNVDTQHGDQPRIQFKVPNRMPRKPNPLPRAPFEITERPDPQLQIDHKIRSQQATSSQGHLEVEEPRWHVGRRGTAEEMKAHADVKAGCFAYRNRGIRLDAKNPKIVLSCEPGRIAGGRVVSQPVTKTKTWTDEFGFVDCQFDDILQQGFIDEGFIDKGFRIVPVHPDRVGTDRDRIRLNGLIGEFACQFAGLLIRDVGVENFVGLGAPGHHQYKTQNGETPVFPVFQSESFLPGANVFKVSLSSDRTQNTQSYRGFRPSDALNGVCPVGGCGRGLSEVVSARLSYQLYSTGGRRNDVDGMMLPLAELIP
jgi:hypothetical protein